MTDPTQFVTDLDTFVRLMEGEPTMNKPQEHPMKKVNMKPGEALPSRPEIEGFTIERLTDEEKTALGIKKDYRLSCGKAFAERLRINFGLQQPKDESDSEGPKRPAVTGPKKKPRDKIYYATVAGIRTKVNIPTYPRWHFRTLEEAYNLAEALAFKRISTPVTKDQEVPAKVMDQFRRVIGTLAGREPGREIDLEKAVAKEIVQTDKKNSPVVDLIVRYAMKREFIEDGVPFDLYHPKGHLQFKAKDLQRMSRVLFEVHKKFPGRRADDITEDEARLFLEGLGSGRMETDKARRGLADASLVQEAGRLSSMYGLGIKKGLCSTNPFAEQFKTINARIEKAKKKAGPRVPLAADVITHLIRTTWEIDRPMLMPIGLTAFAGFRRIELYRAEWRCLFGDGHAELYHDMVKINTPPRRIPSSPFLIGLFAACTPGYLTEKLVTIPYHEFERRFTRIKEACGIPGGGKDDLRKLFTIYWQWNGAAHRDRQFVCGQHEGSPITHRHYDGDADGVWAALYFKLTLENMLGFSPGPKSIPPLVSLKGTGYTATMKDYAAKKAAISTAAKKRYWAKKLAQNSGENASA